MFERKDKKPMQFFRKAHRRTLSELRTEALNQNIDYGVIGTPSKLDLSSDDSNTLTSAYDGSEGSIYHED